MLTLTALGIVYGDIGTSPLYAIREAFHGPHAYAVTQANVYGMLSLVTWALILVVSVKYLVFVLRADNGGEGGILSLLALVLHQEQVARNRRLRGGLVLLGLFGAALLSGDGILTPAVSVLSALEGLDVATPAFEPFVVPITVVILVGLFSFQRFGTARVGVLFGPITLLWFVTIAVLGTLEIVRGPRILVALNPWYGVRFFLDHGAAGFAILAAVFLVVTGGEALYADMGHLGKRPIRVGWLAFALPALLLNYYGQGALLLSDPGNPTLAANPFYNLAPRPFLYPLIAIAISAAIVASQALISGSFSLAQQCMQLGYSPRLAITHTSYKLAGQIYVPEINTILMLGCVVLVLVMQKSANLTAAYGIAVTGTMAITSILFAVVARYRFHWRPWAIATFLVFSLGVDLIFLASNVVKIASGGWITLAMALVVFIIMTTWKTGRQLLNQIIHAGSLPTDLFLGDVARKKPTRVPGTAVFMTSAADGVPLVLLHHLKHNKVLHEQVILMSIKTVEVPEVLSEERLTLERLEYGFHRVSARYGFMETPDVPEILYRLRQAGLKAKQQDTTFYLGHERIIVADHARGPKPGARTVPDDLDIEDMSRWRKKLFVYLHRNARSATESYGIPPNRVVELGAQVEF